MVSRVLRRGTTVFRAGATVAVLMVFMLAGVRMLAQGQGGAAPEAPQTAQASAPIDLVGNWVAVVTEDWRWRMVTPPKGDYQSLPLNPEGIKVADTWTPAQDGQCEAYGVGGLLRMPTRVRITWQDPETLKVETDAGVQTRLLHFATDARMPNARTLQGFSKATWERPGQAGGRGGGGGGGGGQAGGGRGPVRVGGSLMATTTMQRAGWLRKNGVPYSENAEIKESFERFSLPNGDEWFAVTTVVHDPIYYNQDVVVSSHFKREPDGSKWSPAPCRAR